MLNCQRQAHVRHCTYRRLESVRVTPVIRAFVTWSCVESTLRYRAGGLGKGWPHVRRLPLPRPTISLVGWTRAGEECTDISASGRERNSEQRDARQSETEQCSRSDFGGVGSWARDCRGGAKERNTGMTRKYGERGSRKPARKREIRESISRRKREKERQKIYVKHKKREGDKYKREGSAKCRTVDGWIKMRYVEKEISPVCKRLLCFDRKKNGNI